MASKDKAETYEKGEAQSRFEAALRGAKIAGHKPMSDMKINQSKTKKKRPPKKS